MHKQNRKSKKIQTAEKDQCPFSRTTKWIRIPWLTQDFIPKVQSYVVYSHHHSRAICVNFQQLCEGKPAKNTDLSEDTTFFSWPSKSPQRKSAGHRHTHKHGWLGLIGPLSCPCHPKYPMLFGHKFHNAHSVGLGQVRLCSFIHHYQGNHWSFPYLSFMLLLLIVWCKLHAVDKIRPVSVVTSDAASPWHQRNTQHDTIGSMMSKPFIVIDIIWKKRLVSLWYRCSSCLNWSFPNFTVSLFCSNANPSCYWLQCIQASKSKCFIFGWVFSQSCYQSLTLQ